ncbi:SusC/RagA family TonB-linked outer membrane protein [Mariniphaga sediminis]|nr:SusC/RagA family TonB-linked outer membrane protein [Mariniphaga sediminis]
MIPKDTIIQSEKDDLIQLGFGLKREKGELSAAVGIIKSSDIIKSSAINPANALFGKIPGLAVMENGGGSWRNDPDLFIRGTGTSGDASILVLVDGFERPISSLSIHEIESIEVLKDAAALAMFGLRGANGVLLVTTKRGNDQGQSVSLSYEHGITRAFRLPEFQNSYDYAVSMNQARSNDGLSPLYSSNELNLFKSGNSPYFYPNVDWINESLRDYGNMDNWNASFQGNIKGIRYFSMLNYQTDKGLLGPVGENKGYDTQLSFNKFNLRTNIDVDLTKSTNLSVNLGGYLRESQSPGNGQDNIMYSLFSVPSAAFPVKTYNNNWGGSSAYVANPVAQISASGYGIQYVRELFVDGRLEQELDFILDGLSGELAMSYDNSATFMEGKIKQFEYETLDITKDPDSGNITDTTSNFFGEDTELSYYHFLGSQWRRATFEGNLKYSYDWGNSKLNSALIFQQDNMVRTGQFNTFIRRMIALNAHYSLRGKYFADLSMSYNGTNILPDGQRFGMFPAVSFAWNLSDEDWFDSRMFNYIKLRTSWGLAGNDLIPQNINTTKIIGAAGYYFTSNNNYISGFKEGALGNADVTYETSNKVNLGIDAKMFEKLDLTVDLFYDRRKNILVESSGLTSEVFGNSTGLTNTGIIENKGLELGLNLEDKIGDFGYFINGQLSFVRNKIIEMGEEYRPYEYLKRTGRSVGQAFGLEAIGFFEDEADIQSSPKQLFSIVKPGDIKYKDQNDDGVVDEYDIKPIGYNTINPELYFSASIGAEYKGFGFDALFQGAANQTQYLNTPSVFWPLRGYTTISESAADKSWTIDNKSSAVYPRLTTQENANNYRPNDIWFKNGGYLKLRSVELFYNLPHSLLSNFKLSEMQLYLRATNLFSVDDIKVVDPESVGVGYPTTKLFSIGTKIDF